MKILYVLTTSDMGGAQVHVGQLAEYFSGKKHAVAVAAKPGGWLEGEARKTGAHFYPNPYFSNNIFNVVGVLRAAREVRRVVGDFKPDLVACHNSVAAAVARLAIRGGAPTVFTVHGWAFTPGNPAWRRLVGLLSEKLMARYVDKVICVSDYDRMLALKYRVVDSSKLVVIHNGVSLGGEPKLEGKFRTGKQKLLFVGRLNRQKNPELLLKAYFSLPPEVLKKSSLTVVGGGPKRGLLGRIVAESRSSDRVSLRGPLSPKEVVKLMDESHIFVLTTNWEGFPITTLEAMSRGMVPVVTDVGGSSEALDEKSGVVVSKGDKEGLKNTLSTLLQNPGDNLKMAKAARDRVKRSFSLKKMLSETEAVYESVLK